MAATKLTLLKLNEPLAGDIQRYADEKGIKYATACKSLLHEKLRELKK